MKQQPTPDQIIEHAKLRRQVMDMLDPVKNHARMERDRKAYERGQARKEAYDRGVRDAERAEAKAKAEAMLREFVNDWKD